jgi:opacity protein-like surface antigen
MTKLLAIVTLGTVLAAPAFAQQAPNPRQDAQATEWSSRVHVYAPEYFAGRRGNANVNPDFQLGGGR